VVGWCGGPVWRPCNSLHGVLHPSIVAALAAMQQPTHCSMGRHSVRQAYHEPSQATVLPMTHVMAGQHKPTVSMAAISPSIWSAARPLCA
jgi:hypothetical protein